MALFRRGPYTGEIPGGVVIKSGTGAPAIAGTLGDLYVRKNPSGATTTLYRCTATGAAGVATWAGIL